MTFLKRILNLFRRKPKKTYDVYIGFSGTYICTKPRRNGIVVFSK